MHFKLPIFPSRCKATDISNKKYTPKPQYYQQASTLHFAPKLWPHHNRGATDDAITQPHSEKLTPPAKFIVRNPHENKTSHHPFFKPTPAFRNARHSPSSPPVCSKRGGHTSIYFGPSISLAREIESPEKPSVSHYFPWMKCRKKLNKKKNGTHFRRSQESDSWGRGLRSWNFF